MLVLPSAEILAATAAEAEMPWLTPLIAISTLLLGSGGIVAWRRLTHDKRVGVAQQETAEDDALSNRWKAIIETQTRVLLEPMQAELATAKDDLVQMKIDMALMRTELDVRTRKYWGAISHIRTLNTWIARHLPDSIEQVPPTPAILAEDI